MKKLAALTLSLFLTSGIALADSTNDSTAAPAPAKPAEPAKPKAAKKANKSDSAVAAQLEELRQAVQAQQEELQLLKEELAKRDKQIDEAREAAAAANARATEATSKATEAVNSTADVKAQTATLNSTVSDLKSSTDAIKSEVDKETADAQKGMEEGGPLAIRYKGIEITPGGFVEAATVTRSRALGDDINTQLTGITYPNNALSRITENVFSARQSRLSLRINTEIAGTKVTGYVETDFLGTGVTSNNRQSNSYVMRYRQFWGRAAWENGFSFTGGQMWSLVTENKKGIENLQEQFPMMIDPQYIVGWAWQRADSLRVTKSFGEKFAVAASIEGPQTTFTGHNSGNNFFFNVSGAGGGLNNFADTTGYTANKSPDLLVKAALDPGWGHYEVVGILSPFRDRVYPCGAVPLPAVLTNLPAACAGSATSVAGAFNDSEVGGGIGATARLPIIAKKFDIMGHFQGGDGIGRYSSAQLSDVTVRPDGTLAPIRGAAWLGEIELHPNPKFDFFAYYGGEYAARTDYTITNSAGHLVGVGYGSPLLNNSGCVVEGFPSPTTTTNFPPIPSPTGPGSAGTCTGDVRVVWEGTLGFWHNIYTGPKGRLRWGITYSYLTKDGWSGNNQSGNAAAGASVSPKALDNMVFTSFRYYLP